MAAKVRILLAATCAILPACTNGAPAPGDRAEPRIKIGEVAEIDLGGAAGQGVAVTGGAVWVGLHHAGSVAKIDPSTGEEVARIETGNRPGSITTDGESVWVANYGSSPETASLSRIDPVTGEVTATVSPPALPDLCCDPAIGGGVLWVPTGGAHALVGVDATSGEVRFRYEFELEAVDGLTVVADLVWFGDGGRQDARILAVNPSDGSVVHDIPMGNSATPSATDGELVWGLNVNGLFALDPTSGHTVKTVEVDVQRGVLAVGEGSVWVAGVRGGSGVLYRIDPVKGSLLGELVLGETPSRVAVGEGSVWISDFDAGKLYRVDPA